MMRTVTALLVLLIVSAHARSQTCADLVDRSQRLACYDRVAACADTKDTHARLRCFEDRDAGRSAPAVADLPRAPDTAEPTDSEPADAHAPASAAALPEAPRREPAATSEPSVADSAVNAARVSEVAVDHRGRSYLTLDNGDVWQELDESRFRFRPGMKVELSRGIFGSVNLHAEGMDGYVKVRRVD